WSFPSSARSRPCKSWPSGDARPLTSSWRGDGGPWRTVRHEWSGRELRTRQTGGAGGNGGRENSSGSSNCSSPERYRGTRCRIDGSVLSPTPHARRGGSSAEVPMSWLKVLGEALLVLVPEALRAKRATRRVAPSRASPPPTGESHVRIDPHPPGAGGARRPRQHGPARRHHARRSLPQPA